MTEKDYMMTRKLYKIWKVTSKYSKISVNRRLGNIIKW